MEAPTNKEAAVLEGGLFVTIVTLLRLRGSSLEFGFIGTQLLPSSLNCKPFAAA